MDSNKWLWRKKPVEKTIIAAIKQGIPVKGNVEVRNESGRDRIVKNLNEKLASVLLDDNDLATCKEGMKQDAISDQGKEEDSVSLRKQLDEVMKQHEAANERLACSEAELKKLMQELHFLRQEQEQNVQKLKDSSELEKEQKLLEEKLSETSKGLATLAFENANLTRALLVKEELVEELHKRMAQNILEFNTLMARLDSTEKENAFLKYEFHMLEKELEIRNEELEYNCQSADASRKQHMESVRTIAKLEAECQRLHSLMRKKLPGPTALTRMKVELEQGCPAEGRRMSNHSKALVVRDAKKEKSPEVSVKNINFLIEQLRSMEEENRNLLEVLAKKNDELESSRAMFSLTASKLSHVESRLSELNGIHRSLELDKSRPISKELYPIGGSDADSIDGVSSSGSWANALISELEHFKEGKFKTSTKSKRALEMHLMDDFVEMEKLALVSAEKSNGSNKQFSAGKELISVLKEHPGGKNSEKPFDWIQDVLIAIFRQQRISRQSLPELLQNIKIVLDCMDSSNGSGKDTTGISECPLKSNFSKSIDKPSNDESAANILAKETSKHCSQSNLSKYIYKIIEMVESILLLSTASENATENELKNNKRNPTDYFVYVFQWRSSELSSILKRFICMCNDFLNGKAGVENFLEELSSTIEWTICNHGTPKDASRARSTIKNQLHLTPLQDGVEVASFEKMESVKTDTEAMLQTEADKSDELMMKLQESEQNNEHLRAELETLRESKAVIEEQVENQKSINEDLDTQLTVTKAKLNEVLQRFSSLEFELEDKSNCCEELEATCLELQLQLESTAKKETDNHGRDGDGDGKQSQNGWEIAAASIRLAECQETILNLGKQLKTIALPREAALIDKVFNANGSTTTSSNNKAFIRRFSLRDQLLAEDNAKAIILRSPITEIDNNSTTNTPVSTLEANPTSTSKVGSTRIGPLTIVPAKKHEGLGFLRRMLMRRKKSSSKKLRTLAKVNSGKL